MTHLTSLLSITQASRFPRADPFRVWCRTNGLAGLDVDEPKLAESSGFNNLVVFGEENFGVWATTVFSKLTMLMGGGRPRFRSGPLYNHVDNMTIIVPRINYVCCQMLLPLCILTISDLFVTSLAPSSAH